MIVSFRFALWALQYTSGEKKFSVLCRRNINFLSIPCKHTSMSLTFWFRAHLSERFPLTASHLLKPSPPSITLGPPLAHTSQGGEQGAAPWIQPGGTALNTDVLSAGSILHSFLTHWELLLSCAHAFLGGGTDQERALLESNTQP